MREKIIIIKKYFARPLHVAWPGADPPNRDTIGSDDEKPSTTHSELPLSAYKRTEGPRFETKLNHTYPFACHEKAFVSIFEKSIFLSIHTNLNGSQPPPKLGYNKY